MIRRPSRVGDEIVVNDYEGRVIRGEAARWPEKLPARRSCHAPSNGSAASMLKLYRVSWVPDPIRSG